MVARLSRAALAACLVLAGCGVDPTDVEPDAGAQDAGGAGDDAGGRLDARVPPEDDGGASCGASQHLCGEVCTDAQPNLPENGCRLGCGDPCPGAGAICAADGTCDVPGCEPMTCEDLGAECGTPDDGCGRRISCGTCEAALGQFCEASRCVCDQDGQEPNDTSATATMLGAIDDTGPIKSVTLGTSTIHASTDVDWFRVPVVNSCCDGDPIVVVSLGGLPAGEDYDLAAYYQCADGNAPTCVRGTTDGSVASGGCAGADTIEFQSNCDPDGAILVRVTAPAWGGSCGTYRIDVSVR